MVLVCEKRPQSAPPSMPMYQPVQLVTAAIFAGALTGRSAAKAGSAGMASVNASAKRTFLTSAPNSQFDAQTIFRFFTG